MSKIDLYQNHIDPMKTFREEYLLKALSPQQAQWIRRNKGTSEIVEAAEGCILPSKSFKDRKPLNHKARGDEKSPEQGNSGKQ
jgi:hypothetical protein